MSPPARGALCWRPSRPKRCVTWVTVCPTDVWVNIQIRHLLSTTGYQAVIPTEMRVSAGRWPPSSALSRRRAALTRARRRVTRLFAGLKVRLRTGRTQVAIAVTAGRTETELGNANRRVTTPLGTDCVCSGSQRDPPTLAGCSPLTSGKLDVRTGAASRRATLRRHGHRRGEHRDHSPEWLHPPAGPLVLVAEHSVCCSHPIMRFSPLSGC